ncbi:uncharacterized protein ARMOST_15955 [Armillaria ostoyae]|uniref:Uncharacterized protein n=1 Tax=Armillaria ostoyae TaxID=47428 RepID=A0A284RUU9_ARMOS|nr:uncharacterized protein ARMOST_15955 [Armillaria ostoyae]
MSGSEAREGGPFELVPRLDPREEPPCQRLVTRWPGHASQNRWRQIRCVQTDPSSLAYTPGEYDVTALDAWIFLITTPNNLTPQRDDVSSRPTTRSSTASTPYTKRISSSCSALFIIVNLEGTEVLERRHPGILRNTEDHILSGLPLFRLHLGLALAVELLDMRPSRAYRNRARQDVLTRRVCRGSEDSLRGLYARPESRARLRDVMSRVSEWTLADAMNAENVCGEGSTIRRGSAIVGIGNSHLRVRTLTKDLDSLTRRIITIPAFQHIRLPTKVYQGTKKKKDDFQRIHTP